MPIEKANPTELSPNIVQCTLQPLYNTVRYNTVFDITRFKDGSQKCIGWLCPDSCPVDDKLKETKFQCFPKNNICNIINIHMVRWKIHSFYTSVLEKGVWCFLVIWSWRQMDDNERLCARKSWAEFRLYWNSNLGPRDAKSGALTIRPPGPLVHKVVCWINGRTKQKQYAPSTFSKLGALKMYVITYIHTKW